MPLTVWWANAVLLVVTLYAGLHALSGLRSEVQRRRKEWWIRSQAHLIGRPTAGEIAAVIHPVLPGALPDARDAVVELARARPDAVVPICDMCELVVNPINRFAEAVDEQLVDLWPIVRNPDLHLALLRELTLVEPLILYDSLVRNRGRWGQRPILLREALDRLRANSIAEELQDAVSVAGPDGREFEVLPAVGRGAWWTALANRLRPPTITTRGKVAQRSRRLRLGEELRRRGVEMAVSLPW